MGIHRTGPCLASQSCCCLLVGCLSSQQHTSVSQGRICTDNFTCCHSETEVADPTFYLTQSQYTDTGPTSPSTDPIMPGAWQGSHWSANFEVTGMTRPGKTPAASGIRTPDLPPSRRRPTRRLVSKRPHSKHFADDSKTRLTDYRLLALVTRSILFEVYSHN